MLMARVFSYPDAHRARIGANYEQLPINAPKVPVHTYTKDGAMRVRTRTDPVYAPNSYGGPVADPSELPPSRSGVDGDMVRTAYTLHAEDDDWVQPRHLVREVIDTRPRDFVTTSSGTCLRRGERADAVARSSTGRTSTRTSARRSRRCASRSWMATADSDHGHLAV